MKRALVALAAIAALAACVADSEPNEVTVYRTPTCGCCTKWAEHLEANGFTVVDHVVSDLSKLKARNGITRALSSCHTAFVGDYVIEGHVPAEDIARLLETKPEIAGLAVPGMPIGSPGMEGPNPESYRVLAFDASGRVETFSRHGP